jgi:putative membrane protein
VASRIETFFSDADREAIRAATTAAERVTAGELVVYVTERCDPYPEAAFKAALVGAASGALCAAIAVWIFGGWGAPDYLWMLVGLQLGLFAGWIASRFEGIRRRLIDRQDLTSRVQARAAEAFLEQRVFETQDRTGVLIFVTLFEHQVVLLPDDGVGQRVEARAWDTISEELARGIRAGAPASALIRAVERCANLLSEHGVSPTDSRDELSNEPRFRRD